MDKLSDTPEQKITLEEHFMNLEEQIGRLEQADLPLEDAFEIYKKGLDEIRETKKQLDAMEQMILVMNPEGELEEFE